MVIHEIKRKDEFRYRFGNVIDGSTTFLTNRTLRLIYRNFVVRKKSEFTFLYNQMDPVGTQLLNSLKNEYVSVNMRNDNIFSITNRGIRKLTIVSNDKCKILLGDRADESSEG